MLPSSVTLDHTPSWPLFPMQGAPWTGTGSPLVVTAPNLPPAPLVRVAAVTTVTLSGKDASGVTADALVLATAAATETGGPATLLAGDLLPAGVRRALEAALPVLGVKGTADTSFGK